MKEYLAGYLSGYMTKSADLFPKIDAESLNKLVTDLEDAGLAQREFREGFRMGVNPTLKGYGVGALGGAAAGGLAGTGVGYLTGQDPVTSGVIGAVGGGVALPTAMYFLSKNIDVSVPKAAADIMLKKLNPLRWLKSFLESVT